MTRILSFVLGVTFIANGTAARPAEQQSAVAGRVTCNRFAIKQALSGDILSVSLDTDLPDNTQIMVSVSRTYFEGREEFITNYIEEKSTVGRWRQPQELEVSHDSFRRIHGEQQRKLAQAGIAGKVSRISNDIVVSFVVPVHQFGRSNVNLTGSAVTLKGSWHMVSAEARVPFPLAAKAGAQTQWVNRNDLVVGHSYTVSRDTPLMTVLNPKGFEANVAAVESRKLIPAKGSITVTKIETSAGDRWYQVQGYGVGGALIGSGWVNADALIGQQVQVKEKR